jgi:hypothetical protein
VTTKNPKTTFRLASELTGMEGMVECTTWEKVRVAFLARGLVWGRGGSCLRRLRVLCGQRHVSKTGLPNDPP